jgi:o-succinylbenzoate synthase
MALNYSLEPHLLEYLRPATTSRGALNFRKLWILKVWDSSNPETIGQGEIGIIPNLSPEDRPDIEDILETALQQLQSTHKVDPALLQELPALSFALECAILDLEMSGKGLLFPSAYAQKQEGIKINGLVWMHDIPEMVAEAKTKIEQGFDCIKFKVGALDFDSECRMLESIRKLPNGHSLEIRLDANGAFSVEDALLKLKELHKFSIHSIEQPIKPNQWDAMQEICAKSPFAIALDEELIGVKESDIERLLKSTKPQYIILKPSLVGGLRASDKWIEKATKLSIGWWATSALESNIGLNAIAQWVAAKNPSLPQGLGTGKLYKTNFEPETEIRKGYLWLK